MHLGEPLRGAEINERLIVMKKLYLAYGSNLNVEQMKMRCPGARVVGTAVLKNYELLFKGSKSGSFLTVEKKKGALVPLGVWEVSELNELRLDRYEGYPTFYYKKKIEIEVKDLKTKAKRKEKAFIYIMHEDRKIGVPSSYYIRTCVDGYSSFGFDLEPLVKAFNKSLGEANNEDK